jgi:hypothetical protein
VLEIWERLRTSLSFSLEFPEKIMEARIERVLSERSRDLPTNHGSIAAEISVVENVTSSEGSSKAKAYFLKLFRLELAFRLRIDTGRFDSLAGLSDRVSSLISSSCSSFLLRRDRSEYRDLSST